ncbi:MAG: AAA family ATPase [candidate division Zixibacteria bacterium]
MIIKNAHINGFGVFSNKSINGFDHGINVVYGPNEFGKSTILEFIRRVLFGFPRASKSLNQYLPLDGGQYGGVLECLISSGEKLRISRLGGNGKRKLTITVSDKMISGPDALRKFIGSITENVFNNVYAFGLNELQIVESLEDEEISNFIYGTGLGLGKISPVTISREIAGWQNSLYLKRGRTQPLIQLYKEMNELRTEIKQCQNEIDQYDHLVQQRENSGAESDELKTKIENAEEGKQKLEALIKMFPVFQEMTTKQKEIDGLPDSPKISDKQLKECEELSLEVSNLKLRHEELVDEKNKLQIRKDQININHSLLEHKPTIESLKEHLKSYRDAARDIIRVRDEKKELSILIDSEIIRLGDNWSRKSVSDFTLSITAEDNIKEYKKRLQEAEYYRRRVQEIEFEDKAKSETQSGRLPEFYSYALYGLSALSLAGIVISLTIGNLLAAGFAAAVFLLSTPMVIKNVMAKKVNKDLSSIDKADEDADSGFNEWEDALSEWREYIGNIGLDRKLTPEAALEYFAAIKDIKNSIKQETKLTERIDLMDETITSVERQLSTVLGASHSVDSNTEVSMAIGIIGNELNEGETLLHERNGIIEQIEQLNSKTESLNKKISQQENNLSELLAKVGANSLSQLKEYHRLTIEQDNLSTGIKTSKEKIQLSAGVGENYDKFINDLNEMSPSETASRIEKLGYQIGEITSEKTQKEQKIGELRGRIKELNTREDILAAQHNLEIVRQNMIDKAQEWAAATIAKVVFENVLKSAEKNRQPNVIKAAASNFEKFTGGRYNNVYKPADNETLHIEESASHQIKSVDMLSRGTREQLYLAMRLGLIEEYEKLSESMPIIFDDIFANFDDDRIDLAAEAIKRFSQKRQVIIFACRRQTRDLFLGLGSKLIEFA